jgi:hypothetical protein
MRACEPDDRAPQLSTKLGVPPCLENAMTSQRASIAIAARPFDMRRLRGLVLGMSLAVGGLCPNASASEDVAFKELGGEQCFMFSRLAPFRLEGDRYVRAPLELVINNEEDYKRLFDPKIRRQDCDDIDPSKAIPKVDFSRQTVLGLWTGGSCADTDFDKKVSKDDSQKWVIYSVTVLGSDIACSGPGLESLNLIAIPRIPAEYKVFFETFRKHK